MRPDTSESLRAIQGAVAERFIPELTSLFAQEAAQAVTMLTESLIAEADTLAEDLQNDNAALRTILGHARDALAAFGGSASQADGGGGVDARRNEHAASLVQTLDGVLCEAGDGRIAVSSLTRENNRLLSVLEPVLEFIEDNVGDPGADVLAPVRHEAYRQLRRVAVRGWCYFDVSAFRERIASARAELAS